MNKIVIIDGNSLAFSRMPKENEIANPLYKSQRDNRDLYIARKFMKKFLKFKYVMFPGYKFVVVFDEKDKDTFRHRLYPKYKSKAVSAARVEQKEYVYSQIDEIKKLLNEMGIANYSTKDWEADDIIGMLSHKLEKANYLTTIVSGDKDIIQLVSNKTRIAFLDNMRRINLYNRNNIWEISGEVWPDQIIDMKILSGDKSDNIKGLGILRDGAVDYWTADEAREHIVKYGSLNNVINNVDKLKEPFKSSILKGSDKIIMLRKLITIVTDWKVDLNFDEFMSVDINTEGFKNILLELSLEDLINKNKNLKRNLIKEGVEWK